MLIFVDHHFLLYLEFKMKMFVPYLLYNFRNFFNKFVSFLDTSKWIRMVSCGKNNSTDINFSNIIVKKIYLNKINSNVFLFLFIISVSINSYLVIGNIFLLNETFSNTLVDSFICDTNYIL